MKKFNTFLSLIRANKVISAAVAGVLVVTVVITTVTVSINAGGKKPVADSENSSSSDTVPGSSIVESSSSEEFSSSEVSSSSKPVSSAKPVSSTSASSKPASVSSTSSKPASVSSTSSKPASAQNVSSGRYNYNTNLDIEDNVFMDALIYTGYNMKKHRADGNMWVYILAKNKRAMGYLSNISFGGGSTGFETTPQGKPDIKAFERGGFVCASFVTYVYYNYLPNVAGIDTSRLDRPEKSYLADSVYTAVKKWVAKGYSRYIDFTASGHAQGYLTFNPKEEIPIGSIIVFRNYSNPNQKTGSHVCVYAGKKNGMHWVYHTGNKNGPEMCAVERFLFGPDPQWPIAVITTPNNIRMSAAAEITLTDSDGKAVAGSSVTLKESASSKSINLGKTDKNGTVKKENLNYGKYTVSFTVPEGYTADSTVKSVEFTPKNNSLNKVNITLKKKSAPAPSSREDEVSSESDAS